MEEEERKRGFDPEKDAKDDGFGEYMRYVKSALYEKKMAVSISKTLQENDLVISGHNTKLYVCNYKETDVNIT